MSFRAVAWPITGGIIMLDMPPGYDTVADAGYNYTIGSSYDGSVIIGYYSMDGNDSFPCRWDVNVSAGTGVFTPMTGTVDALNATGLSVSADGNTVVGSVPYPGTTLVWWTTLTNGAKLPPLPGDDDTGNNFTYDGGSTISADGSIIIGYSFKNSTSTGGSVTTNVMWTNGVPASWGNALTTSHNVTMSVISADGSTIAGSSSFRPSGYVGFWRSHTFRVLKGAGGTVNGTVGAQDLSAAIGYAYSVSDDGSHIYGTTLDQYGVFRPCYWDSLDTITGTYTWPNDSTGPSGSNNLYGALHILPSIGNGRAEAYAGAANVVVGDGYNVISYAIKWVNGTFINLQPNVIPPGTGFFGRAMAVSANGNIVSGEAADPEPPYGNAGSQSRACYWDVSGVVHFLPNPPGTPPDFPWNLWDNSYCIGVSHDGALLFGDGDYDFSTVNTAVWELAAGVTKGGVGDFWYDPSYVNFNDASVRAGFINPDNSWVPLGQYGELPTGNSPIGFLTCQFDLNPWSFGYNYGQYNGAEVWDFFWDGTDPTTGSSYPDNPTFDTDCVEVVLLPPNKLALDDLLVEDNINVDGAFSIVYRWRSRQFYMAAPISLGACQISLDPEVTIPAPPNTPLLNAADPLTVLPLGVNAMFRLYVGPEGQTLYFTKILDQERMIFRLPSGLKAFNWQFEIVSRVPIHSVELASTMRELQQV